MPYTWTEDDMEKLISCYGQYQCLWNPFHLEFGNKLTRYRAYKQVKNSMNTPGLTVCDCIAGISDAKKKYCYELSKITAAIFCEKWYRPKVKWFKKMHTLLFPHISTSYRIIDFKQRDTDLNNSGTQDHFLNLSFEKSEYKAACLNDTCVSCDSQEIELCLKLRESTHSALKLQDAFVPCRTIQVNNVGTETGSNIAEHETQTDIVAEQRHVTGVNEEEKSCCKYTGDSFMETCDKRKVDNFEIFGRSIAFQLRTIGVQIAMELKKKIQDLIAVARRGTLGSESTSHSSISICCCDCNECKISCKVEVCNCDLTFY